MKMNRRVYTSPHALYPVYTEDTRISTAVLVYTPFLHMFLRNIHMLPRVVPVRLGLSYPSVPVHLSPHPISQSVVLVLVESEHLSILPHAPLVRSDINRIIVGANNFSPVLVPVPHFDIQTEYFIVRIYFVLPTTAGPFTYVAILLLFRVEYFFFIQLTKILHWFHEGSRSLGRNAEHDCILLYKNRGG